jgi:hypothetical protein
MSLASLGYKSVDLLRTIMIMMKMMESKEMMKYVVLLLTKGEEFFLRMQVRIMWLLSLDGL